MKVAVVGGKNETHAEHMRGVISALGAETVFIDTLKFPNRLVFTMEGERAFYQREPLDGVDAYYFRSVFYSLPPYDLEAAKGEGRVTDMNSWYSEFAAERERQSFLSSWARLCRLQGKRVVNPVESYDMHFLKPLQLACLRRAGLPVPESLSTNDPEALRGFLGRFPSVVYKPLAGGALCRRVGPEDLTPERLRLLSNAPVLFQEEIPGDNIRVFVLAGRVLSACLIETDALDYRGREKGLRKERLPPEIEELCVRATEACGMVFTGMDLKRSPEGRWVILECNPSPMFLGFQKGVGDRIDLALARYLMHGAVPGAARPTP